MNVIDKEQERNELEATPVGKKKKLSRNILKYGGFTIIFCAVLLYSRIYNDNNPPYTVVINSVEFITEKTTAEEISNAGFLFSDYTARGYNRDTGGLSYLNVYDLQGSADARTEYTNIDVIKKDVSYAHVSLVNNNSYSKPLAKCELKKIAVDPTNEVIDTVTVEGISVKDASIEKLTEVLGKPKHESNLSDSNEYTWVRSDYELKVTYTKNGIISNIESISRKN